MRALPENVTQELHRLEGEEERLLDLATEGTLPQAKVGTRYREQLNCELAQIEERLARRPSCCSWRWICCMDRGGLYRQADDTLVKRDTPHPWRASV